MKVFRELGVRSVESKRFGLMVIESHPAILRGIVIQTAELLECAQQTIVVEDLVMQPDRLKEFARHRCQDGFVCHFCFLGLLHTDRAPESFPGGLVAFAKQLCRDQRPSSILPGPREG
jgi:hypothetical protein